VQSFGLWVEQLVAESTGKQGKGVVPIAGEAAGAPLGSDRWAAAVTVGTDAPDSETIARVRAAVLPMATIEMADSTALGGEFLRWEVATAAAGFLMEINPFDEPNVQQAKDATRRLLDLYKADRRLPFPEADAAAGGARLTLSTAARDRLLGAPAQSFLDLVGDGDYLALLAYLPPDDAAFAAALERFRADAGRATGCATMFGSGPRYLHSTGQLHKGGAGNGVFVIVTAPPDTDLPIPGEPFSFGVLETAQAIGDFQSLDHAGRRALHVHLPRRDVTLLQRVVGDLMSAVVPRR
jgi:glucose-6-phosphate isomerase/transaldolase/glucose-6-phosphate isomerase